MTTPTASKPLLIDSSGWLEYITEDTKAGDFAPYIEEESNTIVPAIVIYEVFKKLLLDRGETVALGFFSQASRRIVVSFDEHVAVAAARIGLHFRLSLADAIIYATAQAHQAQLITSDTHFQGLPGVTSI